MSQSNLHWVYVIDVIIYLGIISGSAGGAGPLGCEKRINKKQSLGYSYEMDWDGNAGKVFFYFSMGVLWALEDFIHVKLRLCSKCFLFLF